MNHKELLTELAKRLHVKPNEVSLALAATCQVMQRELSAAKQISWQGLGSFELRKKKDRMLVNPATGLQMLVPPKLTVVFKTGGAYKDRLKMIPHGAEQ